MTNARSSNCAGKADTVWILQVLNHWGKVVHTRAYLSLSGAKSALTILEKEGDRCRLYEEELTYDVRIDLEE